MRAIVSDTRTYARLLSESFHPALLGDALERERHFDQLWAGVEALPYLARVVAAERADLERGDIPMFTARPDSRDIVSSGGERIENFFEEAPFEAVRRRIAELSEAGLAEQLAYIDGALAA